MRLVMLLTIPSAIGLIILANPIIALIYQHGRFTSFSTQQTADALRFYALDLLAIRRSKSWRRLFMHSIGAIFPCWLVCFRLR